MIKLITPRRDLYMDGDTSNPEALYGEKGKFYEVEGSSYVGEITFTDETGSEHEYDLESLDKDFWTVDFDKGFEFERYGNTYEFKDGVVMHMGSVIDDVPLPRVMYLVTSGLWDITRFSNQEDNAEEEYPSLSDVILSTWEGLREVFPPEEPSHPYENWKKDIGIAKFQRCIDKGGVALTTVEGIVGYLDEDNGLFYYHKKHRGQNTYLCCKVDEDYDASFNMSVIFLRDNKDVGLVAKSSDILASFKLPEFVEESFNPEYQFKSDNQIVTDNIAKREYFDRQMELAYMDTFKSSVAGGEEVSEEEGSVCTSEQGIASDGGKSAYYKVVLPQWLLDRQQEEGYIMLEDLAEVMYGNDFNFVNVFKAQKRMFEMQQGKGKKGNTLEYDATKCKYYVDKQVEVFNR